MSVYQVDEWLLEHLSLTRRAEVEGRNDLVLAVLASDAERVGSVRPQVRQTDWVAHRVGNRKHNLVAEARLGPRKFGRALCNHFCFSLLPGTLWGEDNLKVPLQERLRRRPHEQAGPTAHHGHAHPHRRRHLGVCHWKSHSPVTSCTSRCEHCFTCSRQNHWLQGLSGVEDARLQLSYPNFFTDAGASMYMDWNASKQSWIRACVLCSRLVPKDTFSGNSHFCILCFWSRAK